MSMRCFFVWEKMDIPRLKDGKYASKQPEGSDFTFIPALTSSLVGFFGRGCGGCATFS